MTENTPMNNTQRIQVVDALRGFAIIAIMLVHFLEHFIYNSYPVSSSPAMASVNETVKEAFFFLFAGKSYTMFALLFGFTYAIQYGNQLKKGKDFAGRFAWRLCLLAGFACLNAIFFPGGDILLTFATVGLILIPVRHLSTTALALASFFFLAQPLEIIYAAVQWISPGWTPPVLHMPESYPTLKVFVDSGNFWSMAWHNLTLGQVASYTWGIDAGRLMQAPGLFILGFILGKDGFFKESDKNTVFWVRTLLISAVVSFTFFIAKEVPTLYAPVKTIFTMWHNVSFTGIWVAAFVLLYRLEYFRKITTGLTFYGKMSLTNYISQSIIGSLIFFPYALGLAPYLGYLNSFLVGLVVMLLQIRFCQWWLARHGYGPLEGLWHRATWIRSQR